MSFIVAPGLKDYETMAPDETNIELLLQIHYSSTHVGMCGINMSFRTGKPLTIWFSLLARAALKVQLEFNSITKVNHVRMSCYSFGTWIINQYQVNRSFFNHFHRWNFSNEKQKRKRDRQTERERGGSGRPSFEIDVCCWCCFCCCFFCCWCVHLEPLINQTM